MHHTHDAHLINGVAKALFTGAPSALLARTCGVPKATARSWRRRGRAPLSVLRQLHYLLQARVAEINDFWRQLGIEIARREGEPPRRRGFFVVDPLTGQNRQNRRGRPRRVVSRSGD